MAKLRTVNVDFRGLERFSAEIKRGLASPAKGNPIRNALDQWGVRYLAFTKRRFVKFSRGSGDWPALKEATVKRRKRPKGKTARSKTRRTGGRVAILWNTKTLLGGLDIGNAGNLFKHLLHAVRVGFSGTKRHPGGRASVADIAAFHNLGEGDVPQRAILVKPDQPTINGMQRDMARAFGRLLRKHDMGKGGT